MTRREQIARLIDPSSWRVLDSYLEQAKRKYAGQDAGYDPEAFRDQASLAIAAQIMALDAVPGEDEVEAGARAAWETNRKGQPSWVAMVASSDPCDRELVEQLRDETRAALTAAAKVRK